MSICVICGQNKKIQQRHFGAEACKPCSSFFRRSVAENKEYVCGFDGNCNIKKGIFMIRKQRPNRVTAQLSPFCIDG